MGPQSLASLQAGSRRRAAFAHADELGLYTCPEPDDLDLDEP